MNNQALRSPSASTPSIPCPSGGGRRCGPSLPGITIFIMTLAIIWGAAGRTCLRADSPYILAAGTKLYVRLEAGVSTKTSHLSQVVSARVVRDAMTPQGVLVPIGSEVTGKIVRVIPPLSSSDHARLLIRFSQLAIPHHPTFDLTAHLTEVENAREKVLPDGTIQGVLEKDAAEGFVDGIFSKLGSPGNEMDKLSGKTLGKIDTSVTYPAGTDLILALDQPLSVDSPSPPTAATEISPALAAAVQNMLVGAPQRVQSKTKKPGDPLNLIVVGSSDQILSAFKQAGWDEARKLGTVTAVGTMRAMVSDNSYEKAPVSQLYLFGRPEDLAFEKILNTFMKRHHLRLWRTLVPAPDGREIWLGASTHDIGMDVHLGVVSHAIDPNLDAERAKVGADLEAGGLVAAERLVSRPNPLTEGKTATGGTWTTDGQMLVIELKTSAAM